MAFKRQNEFVFADSQYIYTDPSIQWPSACQEMLLDYNKNGYLIIRGLFNDQEVKKLCKALNDCQQFWDAEFKIRSDSKYYHQSHWLEPGTDIVGKTAGNAKISDITEQLLDRGEIYLYSGKVIMKPEQTGGAILWHQDFGYYYNNTALFPDMVSVIFALTKSDHENGGLQIIPGSHLCGRINHGKVGGQLSADPERVNMILKHLPMINADLAPGDCLFIHGNLLHKSEPNTSNDKRWNLIFTYNAKSNSPVGVTYNASYGKYKLHKYPADAVLQCNDLEVHTRDYLNPAHNPNIDTKA